VCGEGVAKKVIVIPKILTCDLRKSVGEKIIIIIIIKISTLDK
jgi:hypothetical protein